MRAFALGIAAFLTCACGDTSPSGPSTPERVSGVWMGHATLSAASGGECVGAALQAAIGSRDVFAAPIRQNGTALSAGIAYQGNATQCEFTGDARGTSVALTMTSCRAGRVLAVRCGDGAVRDLQALSGRVTATAGSGTGTGTETTTWSVLMPGTTSSVGTLTTTASFRWNVLGLPSSDFHVFDGSILPGYADGVITIPQEDDPFCVECGWF